jgi:hypothetical protein
MDVRHIVLGRAARADGSDHGAFADSVTFRHRDRAEVDKRHRVAAGRLHRHDLPVRADRAGKAHDPGRRRHDRLFAVSCHVDPSVLAACVRIATVDEGLEHVSGGRPRPRLGTRRKSKRGEGGDYDNAGHRSLLVGELDNEAYRSGSCGRCQFRLHQRERR